MVWAVIVSWMLEILRDMVSGTWSVSLAVVALPVRRVEGPGSSNSSESDVNCAASTDPSRRSEGPAPLLLVICQSLVRPG